MSSDDAAAPAGDDAMFDAVGIGRGFIGSRVFEVGRAALDEQDVRMKTMAAWASAPGLRQKSGQSVVAAAEKIQPPAAARPCPAARR